MDPKLLGLVALLLNLASVFGQGPTKATRFTLYQIDKSCVCIRAKKETKTVIATEVRIGKSAHQVVYEVFWSRTTPKRELFRIEVGREFNGKLVQLWNYGVANEGDFNGDGTPDYSWYGGDDTGQEMYLFLSSGNGYRRVDLLKTVEAAWHRRFNRTPPDLGDVGGNYEVDDLVLEHSAAGLVFNATVRRIPNDTATMNSKRGYRFSIGQADFKS